MEWSGFSAAWQAGALRKTPEKQAVVRRLALRVFEDHVEIAGATSIDLQFAQMLEPTLATEWLAEEDEAAYSNL